MNTPQVKRPDRHSLRHCLVVVVAMVLVIVGIPAVIPAAEVPPSISLVDESVIGKPIARISVVNKPVNRISADDRFRLPLWGHPKDGAAAPVVRSRLSSCCTIHADSPTAVANTGCCLGDTQSYGSERHGYSRDVEYCCS
jgi:hypothetical protein